MRMEMLVPMAGMAMIAVIVGLVTRLLGTWMHHRTLREAMRSDPTSVPLLVEKLDARRPWADAMLGWIFIAFAIGIALLALTDPDRGSNLDELRAALVPLIIGVTILLFLRFGRPRDA
jgi:quinol-cytochrome oxidoreductase complex cytochrome b subunit